MKGKKEEKDKMKEEINHESHIRWTSVVAQRREKRESRDKSDAGKKKEWYENESEDSLISNHKSHECIHESHDEG